MTDQTMSAGEREQLIDEFAAAVIHHHVNKSEGLGVMSAQRLAAARAALPAAEPAAQPLSDDRIDYIADVVVKGMPEGISGFCRSWGWRQFARAILEDCGVRSAPPASAPAAVPEPKNVAYEFHGEHYENSHVSINGILVEAWRVVALAAPPAPAAQPVEPSDDARDALKAMRQMLLLLLEALDVDPETTEVRVTADNKTVAVVTIASVIERADAALSASKEKP